MRIVRGRTAAALCLLPILACVLAAAPSSAADQARVVSDNPVNTTPDVLDGHVNAILQVGDTVYVGGVFSSVQERGASQPVARQNLFAFSASTGALDPDFTATLSGGGVDDLVLAADGDSLYVSGFFAKVNGAPKTQKIAQISLDTGAVVRAFSSPAPDGRVSDLNLVGDTLYIGGLFQSVGGKPQQLVAALDARTGANLGTFSHTFSKTFNGGDLGIRGMDVTPDGTRMAVVGNFRKVDDRDRAQIAVFDLRPATDTLAPWQTTRFAGLCNLGFETYPRDVAYSPDGSYFVVVTTGSYMGGEAAGVLCDSASRWETATDSPGAQPTWVAYTGGDTLTRVAITSAAIYVGGHMRWLNNPSGSNKPGPGAVERTGLAALDPRNGLPLTWNPTRTRGYGVYEFTVTDGGLWMGHDTTWVHGERRSRLAYFPLAGGSAVPPDTAPALPGDVYLLGTGSGRAGTNAVAAVPFDGTSAGSPRVVDGGGEKWSTARASWVVDDTLYTAWSGRTLTARPVGGGVLGSPVAVGLNGLSGFGDELASMTGAFFERSTGRLYYTLAGQSSLYFRAFTPQSQVVGATRRVAPDTGTGVSWDQVGGMFLAGGRLYVASSQDGSLASIGWNGSTTVAGTLAVVSGPKVDGVDWRARGVVLMPR